MISEYLKNLLDSVSISKNELLAMPDKSYKAIYPLTSHIDMDSKEILTPFYQASMEMPGFMGDYNVSPEYVTILSNYRYRYFIIKDRDTYILITLKIVDPPSVQRYFVLTYMPMSLSGVKKHYIELIKLIPCIKMAEIITEPPYTRNTYYNLLEDFQRMSRSKWRSSHGINKLSNLISVCQCAEKEPFVVDEYDKIFEIWCQQSGKITKGDADWRYYIKSDHKALDIASKSETGFVMSFWYQDTIVGMTIGIPYLTDECIIIPTQRSIGVGTVAFIQEYLGVDEQTAQDIKKYLGSFIQYHIHRMCFDYYKDIKALFYGGDMDDKNMKYFKELHYKHSINYRRVPIQEV